ncbi:glycosyl hydrolase 108 family protein [Paraburkholderia sp. RL18-103-BIB-C]|uniref:glycoside hydrolase family 108 protein n=1 Tax=Paraburkholderia sp. RL18-103-BIB-C TaxID=3031637 RepID=UPI0038BBD941
MNGYTDAFTAVVGAEGGYTTDPRDPGNWTGGKCGAGVCNGTKYGVSAATYPTVDIAGLTLDQAQAIYKRDFWDRLQGDQLDPDLAFQVFDAAVNCGAGTAAKWLQRAARASVDGVIGAQSVAAIRVIEPWRVAMRLNAYRLLSNAQAGTFATYGKGWSVRVANNILTMAG